MTSPHDAFSLTRLFITPSSAPPHPRLAQDWVGGVMTEWDAISYFNTVEVGPVIYRNLPVVSPNGLTTGPVLLAKGPAGYLVIGMLGRASATTLIDPIRYRRLSEDLNLPNTTLIDAPLLNFQLNAGTEYALDGALFYNTPSASDMKFAWTGPPNMAVKWGMFGLQNSTTYSVNSEILTDYGDANTQFISATGIPMQCRPSGWFAPTDSPGILQLRVALDAGTSAGTLLKGSWLRLSELGSASGSEVHIKQYTCTASRSYDGSGNPIGATDQDNNVYQGEFPDRSHGNERSILIFPGSTMRSDLGVATVLSARLYLYCFKAEETNGSLVEPNTEPNTSVPATYAGPPSNDATSLHDAWPVPGWFSVECFYKGGANSLLSGILAGDNAVGLPPTLLGLGATGFRGFGFSAALRPYFEVTYAI